MSISSLERVWATLFRKPFRTDGRQGKREFKYCYRDSL